MQYRLILAIPWRELTREMTHSLNSIGLSVRRTFDLQEARRSLENGGTTPCPLHGIGRCSCQYLVLQISRGGDFAAIVVRGGDNRTEITLLDRDDPKGRVASEVYQAITELRRQEGTNESRK